MNSIMNESVTIVNAYIACGSDSTLYRQFLKTKDYDYTHVLAFHNFVESELEYILEIEHEYAYGRQIAETGKIIPKNYDCIVTKDFIEEVQIMEPEVLELLPDLILDNYKESAIVAYKFQLKYCDMILRGILADTEVWELEVH